MYYTRCHVAQCQFLIFTSRESNQIKSTSNFQNVNVKLNGKNDFDVVRIKHKHLNKINLYLFEEAFFPVGT